jgi:hypothetical protein
MTGDVRSSSETIATGLINEIPGSEMTGAAPNNSVRTDAEPTVGGMLDARTSGTAIIAGITTRDTTAPNKDDCNNSDTMTIGADTVTVRIVGNAGSVP